MNSAKRSTNQAKDDHWFLLLHNKKLCILKREREREKKQKNKVPKKSQEKFERDVKFVLEIDPKRKLISEEEKKKMEQH